MEKAKFLLVGAGPTSLGAGYRLRELGVSDFTILEQQPWVGGLAASFVDPQGFTWDIGGHVQFSHYDYFDKAVDDVLGVDGWYIHKRAAFVWCQGCFVPYPFQSNIGLLPRDKMWECLKGLIEITKSPSSQKPANFHEWILATFGKGIADVFMLPYNEKVWGFPPSEMSYQWIGDRVAPVDLEKALYDLLFEKEATTWGPNNTFRFPKHGGTGAIWEAMGHKVGHEHIRLSTPVAKIRPESREVVTAKGDVYAYEHLLATIPISALASMVEGIDPTMLARAHELRYATTNIVGLGFEGELPEILQHKSWMYFPEDQFPFYRLTVFSGYSPAHVPDPQRHYSLMCEMSSSTHCKVDTSTLVERTHQSLVAAELIPASHKVVSKWQFSTHYGYPTPSVHRDAILKDVVPYLESLGIFTRGRFGGWKYEVSNQDHTFMQGVEWVNRIVEGTPEITYRADSAEDPNLGKLVR